MCNHFSFLFLVRATNESDWCWRWKNELVGVYVIFGRHTDKGQKMNPNIEIVLYSSPPHSARMLFPHLMPSLSLWTLDVIPVFNYIKIQWTRDSYALWLTWFKFLYLIRESSEAFLVRPHSAHVFLSFVTFHAPISTAAAEHFIVRSRTFEHIGAMKATQFAHDNDDDGDERIRQVICK